MRLFQLIILLIESVLCDVITFKVVAFSIHTLMHSVLPLLVTVLEQGFWKGLSSGDTPFLPEPLQLR